MAELKGTNITAPIVPNNSRDIYATHLASYGDYNKHVETIEERNQIPVELDVLNPDGKGSGRRSLGMTVTVGGDVLEDWVQYKLQIPGFFRMTTEDKIEALANNDYWVLVAPTIYVIDGGNAAFKGPRTPTGTI